MVLDGCLTVKRRAEPTPYPPEKSKGSTWGTGCARARRRPSAVEEGRDVQCGRSVTKTMFVWTSVTRSDRRERENRNTEQKMRGKKKKKELLAIVLNQPEHRSIQDQPGRSNRNENL